MFAKSSGARVALLLGLVLMSLPSLAQKTEPLTETRVRALMREAQAEAKDDQSAIVLGLDKRVRDRWGDFESFPVNIARREDLDILLLTPYMRFRRALADRLHFQMGILDVPWVEAASVEVDPKRVDAPDIVSVRVERNGKDVPLLKNLLRPRELLNGRGETSVTHGGEVQFPMSAFAPGAAVTITASPQSGPAFVLTLEDPDLQTLR